ncbi:Adenosine/AMP deaminase-like protein 2 [Elsinoe fawcettii]|nr:Adenosine/AMP deaminase-like protein 2 [Elsinoe fawcettii]
MSQTDTKDSEEWKKEFGVPSVSEPFIQKYLNGREALIEQEKRQRSDHAFRETLSPMAREASAIVRAIRDEERRTVWTKDLENELAEEQNAIFPGMMFMQARPRMEQTKLWKIVKRCPKGALLHCHFDAMVDFSWALDQLFEYGGFHLSASAPLTEGTPLRKGAFEFTWRKETQSHTTSIWDSSYKPDEQIPLNIAAESYPNGGKEGFRSWILSRTTITHDESLAHHGGIDEVWEKFMSCFAVTRTMLHYEVIWKNSVKRVLRQLMEDGVQYVDMRAVFRVPFYRKGSEVPEKDNTAKFQALQDAIDEFMDSPEGKNFWGARMIFTDIRFFDGKTIIEGMKECIEMKKKFPDLIAGYDLVGQEDLGRPLKEYLPELFWFKKACAEAGVDIPFFFHAGETLGDGDKVDTNLFDAILLGTRRIGHGFSLYKHPLLIDMVKEKKILIESCPISNEVLRLTSSIMSHPLPALLARGVPVALCNDDPAMLGHVVSGMTHDFWQALQGWENLGLEGLGSLAENSIRWATFDDYSNAEWAEEIKAGAFGEGERAQRMQEWASQWEKYCAWIVEEYGTQYGGL